MSLWEFSFYHFYVIRSLPLFGCISISSTFLSPLSLYCQSLSMLFFRLWEKILFVERHMWIFWYFISLSFSVRLSQYKLLCPLWNSFPPLDYDVLLVITLFTFLLFFPIHISFNFSIHHNSSVTFFPFEYLHSIPFK